MKSSPHQVITLSSQSSSSDQVTPSSSVTSASESTWASAVSAQYQEFEKALAQEQNLILLEEEEEEDNDLFMAPGCGEYDEECSLDDHEDDDDMWLFQDSTNTGIHFPSWWISAHMTPECARACAEMLDLVQQADFAEDVQKLAQHHRRRSQHATTTTNHIQHTSVVAVGPAGIIVRVRVQDESPDPQQQTNIQDIPIPFANSANTVASLRQAVLQTVSPPRP